MASSMFDNASLYITPSGYKASFLYPTKPLGTANFSVVRNTTATRTAPSGLLQSVAANTQRIDYTGGKAGLLVEPAATNQIRNNTMVGAVAGTPGTLPTNWRIINSDGGTSIFGLTQEVLATGQKDGIDYIDIKFSGTATGTGSLGITPDDSISFSLATFTSSTFFEVINNPQSRVFQLFCRSTSAGGSATQEQALTMSPASGILQRFQVSRTFTINTGRVHTIVATSIVSGQTYDFTIRIGLPQMELGSVATSVIKTSTTALTRNADVISVSSVSGLIGATQGTIYCEVNLSLTGGSIGKRIISLSDGTGSGANRMQLIHTATNAIELLVVSSSVTQANILTAINQQGIIKVAAAYNTNDFVLYVNGSLIGTDLSGSAPLCSKIDLGNADGGSLLNGRISAAAIYTSRLSNSELEAITSL
jgi:hypothetical protein